MASAEAPARPRTSSVSKEELKTQSSQLKKTTTREFNGEPSLDELAAITKIFNEKKSNPTALAEHFEIDAGLLMEHQPKDVTEFAKSMFMGLYTFDKEEANKEKFRQRLKMELARTTTKLRKSVTRESTGPSSDDVAAAAKIWGDHRGNVDIIAEKLGVSADLLKQDPPVDANNFGEKLLAGNYTPNSDEAAKYQLRESLRQQIALRRPSLKKTTTKEGESLSQEDAGSHFASTGYPDSSQDPMFAMAVKLYPGRNVKEIDAVAEKLGLSAAHMKSSPGETEQDFARKLMAGAYTVDVSEAAKKNLRGKLEAAIKERRPSLKPTTQRRMSQVSDEEFTNFSAFYTKKGGDLNAIATESGIPLAALKANPPANAADFVIKLMTGMYTVDMDAQAKATLRACMRQEVARTAKTLKKSSTKEWDGKVDEEDVKLIAAAYTKGSGDLKFLASTFSLNHQAMVKTPPKDANDFAKQVLLGSYTTA